MEKTARHQTAERLVQIQAGPVRLEGMLTLPERAQGIVVFAHGSGSSRHSPRNRFVADMLSQAGLATLLMDLLTFEEEALDEQTGQHRFNIGLLAGRLVSATDWLTRTPETRQLKIGYFGASTGAGAALVAAAERPDAVSAVVSRGGRPDLADVALTRVWTPTLLLVGGHDQVVLALNREAFAHLKGEKRIMIIPGATHLFEEPGALEEMAILARGWFLQYLVPAPRFFASEERSLEGI